MTSDEIGMALCSLRPGSEWALDADKGYAGITWLDTATTMPTEAEVEAEAARLKALPPAPKLEEAALFNHENRIRAIEGQPPLALTEFRAGLKGKANV